MLSPKRPLDVAAAGLAVALGAIAFMQWRSANSFARDAVAVNATVVETRTAKRVVFDAEAEVYATVEFVAPAEPEGEGDAPEGTTYRAELVTAVRKLGLSPEGLEGTIVPILFDPENPESVRYGSSKGYEGALTLALLALGALFIPIALRRSSLSAGGGG